MIIKDLIKNSSVIVTGASSGMGKATVKLLQKYGYSVLAGARRTEKLQELSDATGCWCHQLDITDPSSVNNFFEHASKLPTQFLSLVHCAGVAIGMDNIENAQAKDWVRMFEVNVIGTLSMTQRFLERKSQNNLLTIILIGSIAGLEVYENGGGYVATKHAMHSMSSLLRIEQLGKPVRISLIAPGLTKSEFVRNRVFGDVSREAEIFSGIEEPLTPENIAEAILWILNQPSHVNVDLVVLKPLVQATASRVWRNN